VAKRIKECNKKNHGVGGNSMKKRKGVIFGNFVKEIEKKQTRPQLGVTARASSQLFVHSSASYFYSC
jgi:hypothetical protein